MIRTGNKCECCGWSAEDDKRLEEASLAEVNRLGAVNAGLLTERHELCEQIDALRRALEDVLKRDARWGLSDQPNDCGCNRLSRSAEQEYEAGTCPHQRARAVLADTIGALRPRFVPLAEVEKAWRAGASIGPQLDPRSHDDEWQAYAERAGLLCERTTPECEACGGSGVIVSRVTVYEHGCGFPHDDTDESPCPKCAGTGRAEPDETAPRSIPLAEHARAVEEAYREGRKAGLEISPCSDRDLRLPAGCWEQSDALARLQQKDAGDDR
jgi:hypothetical protein